MADNNQSQSAAESGAPDREPDYTIHLKPTVPFEEKYTYVKALGAGGEANCDRYEIPDPYMAVAVKTVVRPSSSRPYLHEANILAAIPKHPNVGGMIEVFQEGPLRIVMPLYSGGDMATLARKFELFSCKIPEAFVWHALVQVFEGLHHLHTNETLPILHRDIKPENLLLDLTPSGTLFDDIKIIDFGMATTSIASEDFYGGTPKFQPPEAPLASAAADVWAVGASVHMLLTGESPKGECPPHLQDEDRHTWYLHSAPKVKRILDAAHDDYFDDLSHAQASTATFDSPTPLPKASYSPLLEYWFLRILDLDPDTRATTAELVTVMASDARRQIGFYQKWIAVCGKRPLCGFAYPEPPAGWEPCHP